MEEQRVQEEVEEMVEGGLEGENEDSKKKGVSGASLEIGGGGARNQQKKKQNIYGVQGARGQGSEQKR